MTIRIGTRASRLALWQAEYVAALLRQGGLKTEIVTMETKGDKILDQPFAEIGTKGIFTEELEEKLKNRELDIAVHSAKDMQSALPQGLSIIAFSEREQPEDVLVSLDKNFSLTDTNSKPVVGTSSARRRAMLKYYHPHVQIADARGNLQTRMKKMENGNYQAMLLAYAGVHRMDYDEFIIEKLPAEKFTPAVGQGSIAIESSDAVSKEKREIIRKVINHAPTEFCLLSERSFLKTLEGGCSVPLFGLATLEKDELTITGGIVSPDGKEMIRVTLNGNKQEAVSLGQALAEKVLEKGAGRILQGIR